MKIKTWLRIIILLSVAVVTGVAIVFITQNIYLSETIAKTLLASEIVKVVNQRENIANDYVNNRQNETIIQWQMMYDVTARLLQSNLFNGDVEQAILEDMRENNVQANQLFSELIILHHDKQMHKKDPVTIQSLETALKSQLLEKGDSIIVGAYRLNEISQQNSKNLLKQSNTYTLISISILITMIVLIILLLRIKILGPLLSLTEGMMVIASGDLDFKLATTKTEEIDQVILTFNDMAANLKARTTAQQITTDKLEKSNKELKQFAYIASHDLQEPLRRICSYLQLIQRHYKENIDKEVNEFIEFAVDGTKRLQTLIDDLLLFSRVQTKEIQFSAVNLEDTLKNTLENLQLAIDENKAIITSDPLPIVNASATQMVMLFQNLLSNAIKFHDDKPPVIHISAQRRDHAWLFGVHDHGIGIDPKDQDKLFVIFKRLVGNEYPGTGIGLAVCKSILDRHNGKIWVESALGKGATFYFTLPA